MLEGISPLILTSTFTPLYQRAVQVPERITDLDLLEEPGILALSLLLIDFSSNSEVIKTEWLSLPFEISEILILHSL